jgi:hypothetical protein
MNTTALDITPQTSREELRYESAVHAVRAHQRAKLLRTIAIVAVLVYAVARVSLAMFDVPAKEIIDGQFFYGVCLCASTCSCLLEWSTGLHAQDRVDAYVQFVMFHRPMN